jgi:hypothetical protein
VARFSRLLTMLVLLGDWTTPLPFSWPDQAKSSSSDPSPSCETAFQQIDDNCYVVEEMTGVKRSGHVGAGHEQFGQERSRDFIPNCGVSRMETLRPLDVSSRPQ